MNRGIALVCLLLVVISVVPADLDLSPVETTVNVADNGVPIIRIWNPQQNLNYNNITSLFVNYTFIEPNLDSEWYNLNNGPDIIISDPFSLDLPEGDYVLKIYVNDTFGNFNFSEVSFTINNSIPYCGDERCNNNEDCSTCSADCGLCPEIETHAPSRGGTKIIYSTDLSGQFTIDKEIMTVSLNLGETEEEYMIIKNIGKTKLDFNISITESIKRFVSIAEIGFTLEAGENKTIPINFIASNNSEPDLYFGGISVGVGEIRKSILVALEIESLNPLFDVKVIIPDKFLKVKQGEDLLAEVEITDIGNAGVVDVIIEKVIKDSEGNIILEKEETNAVEGKLDFIDTIKLPQEMSPGRYVLYYTVYYNGQYGVGSDMFEVQGEYEDLWRYVLLGFFLALLLFLIFSFIVKKRDRRKDVSRHIEIEKEIIAKLSKEKRTIEQYIKHLDKTKDKRKILRLEKKGRRISDKWRREKERIEEDLRRLRG